jgi:hypothetical protein
MYEHPWEPYEILVKNPEIKKQQGRPMHRWKDNIKMGLK